jgi:hypothetical protein
MATRRFDLPDAQVRTQEPSIAAAGPLYTKPFRKESNLDHIESTTGFFQRRSLFRASLAAQGHNPCPFATPAEEHARDDTTIAQG